MKTATTVCGKCGAEIPADAKQGACPACLLETGLGLLAEEVQTSNAEFRGEGRAPRPARMITDFGDYELLEEIGRGGQGVVYRARQKSLNRTVALKVIGLGPWATEAHLKRFRFEAEAAASLDHPCIVPIHEVGERDGYCYFSMNFVEGGQLDEVVGREPLPIRSAAEVIAKLAHAVHYAHEHGILHRDLKPGNILVDQKGEPHLTDFGLARLVETESTVTRTKEVLGTPSYMAPEQAVGETRNLTSVTDVYGLGAVLYQLLTGQPPFAGGTTYETVKLLLETEPRQPRLLNPKVDRDLSAICLKCLEKDPKRRYPAAAGLAEDLEHWLKHEPIRAKRSGFFTRTRKWVRRNPALVGTAAVCLLLGAASIWLLREPDWTRQISAGTKKLVLSPDATALHHYAFYGSVVVDSVGIANGTLLNGASVSAGQLHLDGVDDYVQFDQHIVPTVGDFSVAFFAQEVSPEATYTEIISQGFSGGPGFYVGYDASHNFRIGDVLWETGIPFPSDGFLHHYAVTAGTDTRLYIDGTLAATFGPISTTAGGDHTRLGRQFDPFAEFFNGNLDDLWVFSGTLTADEVASLAAEQTILSVFFNDQ
jgi:serine/threonine protein kinase